MSAELGPSVYYEASRRLVVLALLPPDVEIQVRSPLEVDKSQVTRILVPTSLTQEATAALREVKDLGPDVASGLFVLFPTTHEDLGIVLKNWLSILDEQDWLKGPHGWYLGSEVSDDWTAYNKLMEAELALWRAIHGLSRSHSARNRLLALEEAALVGGLIAKNILETQEKRFGVALNALSDIIRRTMVVEKIRALKAISGD